MNITEKLYDIKMHKVQKKMQKYAISLLKLNNVDPDYSSVSVSQIELVLKAVRKEAQTANIAVIDRICILKEPGLSGVVESLGFYTVEAIERQDNKKGVWSQSKEGDNLFECVFTTATGKVIRPFDMIAERMLLQ